MREQNSNLDFKKRDVIVENLIWKWEIKFQRPNFFALLYFTIINSLKIIFWLKYSKMGDIRVIPTKFHNISWKNQPKMNQNTRDYQ